MTNVAQTLQKFFSSFGIPAYEEHTVPDNAALPYITYEVRVPDWRDQTSISASVWYAGTTFKPLYAKVDEIGEKLDEGLTVPVQGGGSLYLYKDTIFSQVTETGNDNVKVCYLQIGMHALCK